MLHYREFPLVKKLTKLVSLASLSVLITLPATAELTTNSTATQNTTLLAQANPVRNNIAVELETANDAFSTLARIVKAARLNDELATTGALTIFAPTDEAFAALPAGTLETLLLPENRDTLIKVLTYHIVPGKSTSFNTKSGRRRTLQGQSLTLSVAPRGGQIKVNSAKVILADIPARNGTIHGINQVLLPPDLLK
ncbi:beta-Ig-H3/fasciclin [Crinalium epipsammum PCC 9333]|uniref:Beta-Ig-H3/fasciclin n=1 Tax=Crinalium epipsammum PCC 9333 TaxID=1173022 RepID=K9W2X5_9CYAN|nr:fasciclin domain-containing protein [Crinalium epipsammum]AFZ13785.1 beta-Ig-H3/fasciclin [Crinalium epipsammum PCC 9333]